MNITFVIDEEEPCTYTVEGTRSEPPHDNIEIMLRRTTKKQDKVPVGGTGERTTPAGGTG
jgi:hypothetical protein